MERFQPNKRFYKENINNDGFSSSDEFDSKKRVQITNEMPPMDMFDFTHSLLKNDLWKWFLGYSLVMNDISYNEETDGVETIDNEGNITNLTIAKYVNGVRANDYGPIPEKKWNPNYKKDYKEYLDYIKGDPTVEDTFTEDDFKYIVDYSKKGRRIEINGALLPEVDLMLHEAYRYLSILYPDHPDFSRLLTTNEFEDEIYQAASIIDYIPDQTFFNWLSCRLDYSNVTKNEDDIKIQEASMLKIRNLLNHSMRRKLFGAKAGYKMFGSDIYQHISVFPAAEYIPYKEFKNKDENVYSVDIKWLRRFEDEPENLIAPKRQIDKSHVLYKRQFRLFDWTNESYDFPNRWVEPAKFYGTAWPTPYSQFILYEYPLQKVIDEKDYNELKDGLSTTRTIKNDFKVGQKIKIGGQNSNWTKYQTGHISSIREEATYKVELDLKDKDYGELTVHENPNTLTVIDVDVPVNPFYTNFEIWPSNEELIEKIAEYERIIYYCQEDGLPNNYDERIKKSLFAAKTRFDKYIECDTLKDLKEELHKVFYTNKVQESLSREKIPYRLMVLGKFTPDPHQDGCMYMAPEQYMTTFEDELKIDLNTTEWDNYTEEDFYDENGNATEWPKSEIEYGITNMSDEGIIRKGDIIKYVDDEKTFMSQVLGISNAFIQFKFDGGQSSLEDLKLKIREAQDAETSRYGIVMKFSDNNVDSANKKVVFYGNPVFGEPVEIDAKRHFAANSVYFNVKAIPRIKSHMALRAIYKNFNDICAKKFAALEFLIGTNCEESKYLMIKEDLDTFIEAYSKMHAAFDKLIEVANERKLLYKDSNWKKLNDTSEEYISLFANNRPILHKQLDYIYKEWHKKYDVSFEKLADVEEIKKSVNELYAVFAEYFKEYYDWQIEEAAIEISRKHYIEVFTKNYENDVESKIQVEALRVADAEIFENMLPNRALLITPLPNDLLMQSWPTEESSYSLLTAQDKFVSIIEFEKNKYDDMICQKETFAFGSSGLLQNCMNYSCDAWNFGSINTATIVETHYNPKTFEYETLDVVDNKGKIDFLDDYYHSDIDWIKDYEAYFPNNMELKLDTSIEGLTFEQYSALSDHDKEYHYYLNNEDGLYYKEQTTMKKLPYFIINKGVQIVFDNDDNSHKFAYGDPNMMEMFLEDN